MSQLDLLPSAPEVARYRACVMDPPWWESGGGGRGAQNHYPLMKTPAIRDLLVDEWDVPGLMLERSAIFMWVTNTFLADGIWLLGEMGYRYTCTLTWAKTQIGLGYYFRGQTEHVLFAQRGKWKREHKPEGWSSTLIGGALIPRTEHSVKPDELQDMITERFDGPYLECFARRARPGWDALGNEVDWQEGTP